MKRIIFLKGKTIFAENLKYLLKIQGFTYSEFAEKFGLSGQAIGKWVASENEPSLKNLLKIADILNVDLDDLVRVDLKERARKVGNVGKQDWQNHNSHQ